MPRQTGACQLNPVTHCRSKGHLTPERWCFAVKTSAVTFISGLPGGNRNSNGNFNNLGNNGNWWSSTENSSTNAWNRNLNYNNANANRNNNNKELGFSVRCVRDLTITGPALCGAFFSKKMNLLDGSNTVSLTEEIFIAYFECRKNKRNTINALAFEKHFERNLFHLEEEIQNGYYNPGRSIAFIVNKPVKREIFAADFRDRVVHHWLINKLNPLFERIFINDSYACRTGKGTHYGIQRLYNFVSTCSNNYTTDCYILRLDVQGFFMHINRQLLYDRLKEFVLRNYKGSDQALVLEISRKIIFNDPAKNCTIKGSKRDWEGLPNSKSLFHSPSGCGLPIGNLTSQVFANFYMNPLDHFIRNQLSIRFYGRYVDDFVIVHNDGNCLKSIVPKIRDFLKSELRLELHPNKIYLQHYNKGVKFLGAVIKPNRIYISNRTKGNFYEAIQHHNAIASMHKPDKEEQAAFLCSMNSYLGILKPARAMQLGKQIKTYKLRKSMLRKYVSTWWWNLFSIGSGYKKLVLKRKRVKKKYLTGLRAQDCRFANRGIDAPVNRNNNNGFRLAQSR
jgi:RNA-directed DNA polymerase